VTTRGQGGVKKAVPATAHQWAGDRGFQVILTPVQDEKPRHATAFSQDLAKRLSNREQLTADGLGLSRCGWELIGLRPRLRDAHQNLRQ
jgi:hypothetical protein